MKICISSTGPNLTDQVDARFGRCPYFLIIDTDNSKLLKSIVNQSAHNMQGAGITAAQLVANKKVDAIITGNIGPNAFNMLGMSGVKIYTGVFNMSAEQALDEFKKGNLEELKTQPMGGMGRDTGKDRKSRRDQRDRGNRARKGFGHK